MKYPKFSAKKAELTVSKGIENLDDHFNGSVNDREVKNSPSTRKRVPIVVYGYIDEYDLGGRVTMTITKVRNPRLL